MNYCFVHKIWYDTPVCPKNPLKELKLDERGENIDDMERVFHKNLALLQISFVVLLSIGIASLTGGVSMVLFSHTISMEISRINSPDPTLQNLQVFYQQSGNVFGLIGISMIVGSMLYFNRRIRRLK